MNLPISEEKNRVLVDGRWWRFSKPIIQAKEISEKVLIIFDYMTYPKGKPADNLVAFDKNEKELWKADQPINSATSAYVNFVEEDPLRVGNFAGFVCQIDTDTGKIRDPLFTK